MFLGTGVFQSEVGLGPRDLLRIPRSVDVPTKTAKTGKNLPKVAITRQKALLSELVFFETQGRRITMSGASLVRANISSTRRVARVSGIRRAGHEMPTKGCHVLGISECLNFF